MTCSHCNGCRIVSVSGKVSDCCFVQFNSQEHDGYVPSDLGIGGGDYISFSYCLECGRIQGEFPLDVAQIEVDEELSHSYDRRKTNEQ